MLGQRRRRCASIETNFETFVNISYINKLYWRARQKKLVYEKITLMVLL